VGAIAIAVIEFEIAITNPAAFIAVALTVIAFPLSPGTRVYVLPPV
jgi:hypothetical protein